MAKATGMCAFGPSDHSFDRSHLSKLMSEDLCGSISFHEPSTLLNICSKGPNRPTVLKENGYITVI